MPSRPTPSSPLSTSPSKFPLRQVTVFPHWRQCALPCLACPVLSQSAGRRPLTSSNPAPDQPHVGSEQRQPIRLGDPTPRMAGLRLASLGKCQGYERGGQAATPAGDRLLGAPRLLITRAQIGNCLRAERRVQRPKRGAVLDDDRTARVSAGFRLVFCTHHRYTSVH